MGPGSPGVFESFRLVEFVRKAGLKLRGPLSTKTESALLHLLSLEVDWIFLLESNWN